MSDMSEVTKDKLIADVKLVIADTEELLRATAGQAGDKIAEIRARPRTASPRPRSSWPKPKPPWWTRPSRSVVPPTTTCMTTPGVRSVSPPASASSPAC
jgi:hypothetical protein